MSKIEVVLLVLCVGNMLTNLIIVSWIRAYSKHCTSVLQIHNELFKRRHD